MTNTHTHTRPTPPSRNWQGKSLWRPNDRRTDAMGGDGGHIGGRASMQERCSRLRRAAKKPAGLLGQDEVLQIEGKHRLNSALPSLSIPLCLYCTRDVYFDLRRPAAPPLPCGVVAALQLRHSSSITPLLGVSSAPPLGPGRTRTYMLRSALPACRFPFPSSSATSTCSSPTCFKKRISYCVKRFFLVIHSSIVSYCFRISCFQSISIRSDECLRTPFSPRNQTID